MSDNIVTKTWVAWDELSDDGEEYEIHEAQVAWEFSPIRPGRYCGPLEACYQDEGGELLECRVIALYDADADALELVSLDGEEFMRDHGIDFDDECEKAWAQGDGDE